MGHGGSVTLIGRRTSTMATILFLGANPSDTTRLALDREAREIAHRLRATPQGHEVRFAQEWAVRAEDLQDYLLRHKPDLVHFSGHGSERGELLVENERGQAFALGKEALSDLFRILRRNVRCVVLSACFSVHQVDVIARYIDCVIGMSIAIPSESAVAFAGAFYQALGYGESVQTAFNLGCNQIDLQALAHADVPRLMARPGIRPEEVCPIKTAAPRSMEEPCGPQIKGLPALPPPRFRGHFVGRIAEMARLANLVVRPVLQRRLASIGPANLPKSCRFPAHRDGVAVRALRQRARGAGWYLAAGRRLDALPSRTGGQYAGLAQARSRRKSLQGPDDACDQPVDAHVLSVRADVLLHVASQVVGVEVWRPRRQPEQRDAQRRCHGSHRP
jgi:hypothetical protein